MVSVEDVAIEVVQEYRLAVAKFKPFHSGHEGYAVIKEELDELWDEIKKNGPSSRLKSEAIQVAAMAIRFITDICGTEV
jgi:hypothetical protein